MSFYYVIEKNRTVDVVHLLYEDDGSTSVTLAADDVVRFKMGRRDGAQPSLDLDSAGDTSNGSGVTVDELGTSPTAQATIRFAQGDTSGLVAGVYEAEISVVDNSETSPTDAIKSFEFGTVAVLETLGGSVGLT